MIYKQLNNQDEGVINNNETVITNLLWTGGWDSTYRLLVLLLIEKKTISGNIAKKIFPELFEIGNSPEKIVEEKGLVQVTDSSEIDAWVEQAINENQDAVESIKNGAEKAIGRIAGTVMKLSRGKANPAIVQQKIKEKI